MPPENGSKAGVCFDRKAFWIRDGDSGASVCARTHLNEAFGETTCDTSEEQRLEECAKARRSPPSFWFGSPSPLARIDSILLGCICLLLFLLPIRYIGRQCAAGVRFLTLLRILFCFCQMGEMTLKVEVEETPSGAAAETAR